MKRCPECGSINEDDDPKCGVCGKSMSGVNYEPLDKLADVQLPPKSKKELHPRAIAMMIASFLLIGVGVYELVALSNGAGFIMVILGLGFVVTLLGGWDAPPLRRR